MGSRSGAKHHNSRQAHARGRRAPYSTHHDCKSERLELPWPNAPAWEICSVR
jgi:hypothetical protein